MLAAAAVFGDGGVQDIGRLVAAGHGWRHQQEPVDTVELAHRPRACQVHGVQVAGLARAARASGFINGEVPANSRNDVSDVSETQPNLYAWNMATAAAAAATRLTWICLCLNTYTPSQETRPRGGVVVWVVV